MSRKAWTITAAIASMLFASVVVRACNVAAISVVYEQAYNSSDESALVVPTTFKEGEDPANVVLDKYKINIWKACAREDGYSVTYFGNASNYLACYGFTYSPRKNSGHLVFGDEDYGDQYAITTKSDEDTGEKDIPGGFIVNSPKAATDVTTGEEYDVRMTVSNIKVKHVFCDKDDGTYTRTALVYGFGTIEANDHPSWAKPGVSFFTGKSLVGYDYCRSGAKYNVKIRLYYHGTDTQVNNKIMMWAANDIDIGDRTIGKNKYYEYSSSHSYAEHIRLINGVDTIRNNHLSYVVSGSNNLGFSNNAIYKAISDPDHTSAEDNNSCSTLFKADMDSFEFEWGGSACGTTIDSVPFSLFKGTTRMYYGSPSPISGTSKYVTVNGPTSQGIAFEHLIRREKIGSSNPETENYTINKKVESGSTVVSDNTTSGTKRFWTLGVDESVDSTDSFTVNLNPGETKQVSQQLRYRTSDVNMRSSDYQAVARNTITLHRPYAYFNGKITATATKNTSNTSVAITNNAINLTDSDDGHYEITFSNNINRHDTDSDGSAGGKVQTQYSTTYSAASSYPGASGVTWSPTSTASNVNTSSLEDDGNYSFTVTAKGTLKYGETRKICQSLSYVAKQGGGSAKSATNSPYCVTISRPMKKCAVDSSFSYGLVTGKNIGRISVKDKELNKTKRSTVGAADSTVSIYARPTDNIRFEYDMCAGSLYPIYENGLGGASNKVWYEASGSITKNPAVTEEQSKKYLFRTDVPVDNAGTFKNPREWSWQRGVTASSNFLRDSDPSHLEASFTSPSDSVGSSYRCGTPVNGWYQVSGKAKDNGQDECARTGVYNIGVLDAGSTITQKLRWNEMPVTNGTTVGSAERTATASVVIPYNYTLKPYVVNNTARAAYIGEKITMTPGVAVMKRDNSLVSANSYATITKSTSVKYYYYFTDSTGTIKVARQAARAEETRRFNKNGSLDNVNESLAPIEIEIDDSHAVGDRVCVELSVAPYDSHNGTGDAAAALKEGSNGATRMTASCISIAKRPTISVESSNTYSATKITTSYYSKKITSDKFVFSSWSEYGVFGHINKDFLMASGAAAGYSRDGYAGNKALNVARTNPTDGSSVAIPSNSNECTFMTQTFANQNCEQNASAKVIGGVAADLFESRIKERYAGAGKNLVGASTKTFGGISYIDASNINPSDYYDASANLVGVKSDNIYLSKTPTFASDNSNHTIVYHAKNIVINADLNSEIGKVQSNPAGITGVVIFADNVYITDAVHYINAIIIAENVNTCAFKSGNPGTKLEMKDLTSSVCNSSLIFDQPVVTHRLVLNRTAGAGNGTSSIIRAEVFNLNTANFLWSYNQMSRYNQAITTYTRELPPRY